MDAERSELGPGMRAAKYRETLLINHREPKFQLLYTVEAGGQGETTKFELTTDKSENKNQTPIGEEISRTYWSDNKLVTEWQVPAANQTGTIMRWLAEDGNVQYVHYRRQGKDGYKLVFIKK